MTNRWILLGFSYVMFCTIHIWQYTACCNGMLLGGLRHASTSDCASRRAVGPPQVSRGGLSRPAIYELVRNARGTTRPPKPSIMAAAEQQDGVGLSPTLQAEWDKLEQKLPNGINHIEPAQVQAFAGDINKSLVIVDVRTPEGKCMSHVHHP